MSETTQLTDYQRLAGKDRRWHLELCARMLQQAAATPSQRRFATWLRKQKVSDRGFLQFLLRLLDIHVGPQVRLGEAGQELLEAAGGAGAGGAPPPGAPLPSENDAFIEALYDRFVELNGYLVQFVFNELGEDFLAPGEMYRRIGSSAYVGERPGIGAFETWLQWLEWLGYLRTVGFRKQLTEKGREAWGQIRDVPVEELLGGAGTLGVLAGLGETETAPAANEPPATPEPATPTATAPAAASAAPAAETAAPVDEDEEEELPDFGPDGAPPEVAETGTGPAPAPVPDTGGEQTEPATLSEEEAEAIRELFGDEALAELAPDRGAEPEGGNGAGGAQLEAIEEFEDPALRESMQALEAATDQLVAGLTPPPPAATAAPPPEPAPEPPPAAPPAATEPQPTTASEPDASPAAAEPETPPRSAAPEAPAPSAAPPAVAPAEASPAPTTPAAVSPLPAEGSLPVAAARAEILAALWESAPGRRALTAHDLGIERAEQAWGFTLFQLALAATLLEGEPPPPGGLGLYRALAEAGALRKLYAGKLTIDEVIEPPADLPLGENPHGRAIERLAYVPWLRRACRDRVLLTRLRADSAGRASRLRAACGGALHTGVHWVEREMRRLGVWS